MDFEKQFGETQTDKQRQEYLQILQEISQYWPDQVALYNGMVQQLIASGWTDMAARTIVLSNITNTNLAMICNVRSDEETT